MFKFGALLAVVFTAFTASAKDYPVRNAAELAALNLKPGDRIVMAQGDWSNQQLVLKGKGTKEAPILLVSAEPGKLILKGNCNLVIDGQYLIVDGLNFSQGFSLKKDVVTFSRESQYCRLTNTAIIDYNPADKKQDYKWISVNGDHNRVDHCYIKGKAHQGTTLVVWVTDKPGNCQIDHNFFDERPDLGRNGGETIRIGTSNVSLGDSFATVEDNIFYHCNGEMEVISNKSGHNIIHNNLFYECVGTLTLREGNYADVYGNYIIGNGIKGTGGIRIIGENHKVHHNYISGLTGTGLKAAISLMDAVPNSSLSGYAQVKNADIRNNTIVNCAEAIEVGAGMKDGRDLEPVNVTLADNIVLASQPLIITDQPDGIKTTGNILYNIKLAGDLPDGFTMKDPRMTTNALSLYEPVTASKIGAPAITAEQKQLFNVQGIGPGWYKGTQVIRVQK